mgnify:FL=1
MALITAGYWPNAYWAESYFSQNYWPEYMTAIIGGVAKSVTRTEAIPKVIQMGAPQKTTQATNLFKVIK